jgi:hypothetical protein
VSDIGGTTESETGVVSLWWLIVNCNIVTRIWERTCLKRAKSAVLEIMDNMFVLFGPWIRLIRVLLDLFNFFCLVKQ